jgi:hypothetical protein
LAVIAMKFRLSAEYGELSPVRNWQPHSGIDLAMPEGTALRAIRDGVVDRVYDGTGAIGRGLSIKLDDGSRAIYGHMSDVKASVGDNVHAGELVGFSGNTGKSTGPHLHFGIKDARGQSVDPTSLADDLANMSGDNVKPTFFDWMADRGRVNAYDGAETRDLMHEFIVDAALGVADAVKDLMLGFTLVGSAVLILLKVAGWRDGGRYAGMLLVANILLKFLFGVY